MQVYTGILAWSKRDIGYVQCKECGAKFELHEVYAFGEKGKTPEKLKFFRR